MREIHVRQTRTPAESGIYRSKVSPVVQSSSPVQWSSPVKSYTLGQRVSPVVQSSE